LEENSVCLCYTTHLVHQGQKSVDGDLSNLSTFTALGIFAPFPSFAATLAHKSPKRSLYFYNAHTEESLKTVYWANGSYLLERLADINLIMRDHRTGEIKSIDIRLLDLLYEIAMKLEAEQPFHVISGYCSPKTNILLRKRGRATAKSSFHMLGKAVDVSLPECRLSLLHKVARDLRSGG
jgi:uncharacterized protein YcbK (DUF882 family)